VATPGQRRAESSGLTLVQVSLPVYLKDCSDIIRSFAALSFEELQNIKRLRVSEAYQPRSAA